MSGSDLLIRELFREGVSVGDIAHQVGMDESKVRAVIGKSVEIVERKVEGIPHISESSLLRGADRFAPAARVALRKLQDEAGSQGESIGKYVRSGLARTIEKVLGGMRVDIAAERSGLGYNFLMQLMTDRPEVREAILAAQHAPDMRALEAVAESIDNGNVEVAMSYLERQTGDFAPAAKEVRVSAGSAVRAGWAVIDAEFDLVIDGKEK